jgi:Na+/melibiose symporter-like transporter
VTTALLLSIFPAMPVIFRMSGFFPENGSDWLLWSIAGFGALGAGAGSILNISVMSALADIADENALKYGIRQEGVLYSARAFFAKLDNSLGLGIAAVALKLMDFPDKAEPGLVDPNTIWWLGVVDSPLCILPGVIAAIFYAQYRIDKTAHEETRRQLDALPD